MHLFFQQCPAIPLAKRIMNLAERNAGEAKGFAFQVLKSQAPGQGLSTGAKKNCDTPRLTQRGLPRVMISAALSAAADALLID